MHKMFYKIYPPFVDAYRMSWNEADHIDLDMFRARLIEHAAEWGETAISRLFMAGDITHPDDLKHTPVCVGVHGDTFYGAFLTEKAIIECSPYDFEIRRLDEKARIKADDRWDWT